MPFGIGRGLKKIGGGNILGLINKAIPDKLKGMFSSSDQPQVAAQLRARIAREQWEDYKTRFQPLENRLLGYANNREEYTNQAVSGSLNRVNQAYAGGQAQIERRLGSYGLAVTPEMQQRIAQRLGLQKSLSQVQASNVARREADSQLDTIVGGGLSTGARGIEARG